MYLMYVDESGDSGLENSPVNFFVLTGLVLHELKWKDILDRLIQFRKYLRESKGLKLREEIHASEFINNPKDLIRIKRNDRLDILRQSINWLKGQNDINIINIIVDKRGKNDDVFEIAWRALIQRFENTISYRNFPGPQNPHDKGMILPDRTDTKKLQVLLRKMRRYNVIPNTQNIYGGGSRNITLDYIIEDPFYKESAHSYFIQMTDVAAYFLRQVYEPNNYVRKKNMAKYFYKLDPVLCKHASRSNQFGIVEL
jgi:hypothetical protein